MPNATHDNEQLIRYLDGEMTAEEKNSFEKILSTDQQLRSELETLQMARDAIRFYGLQKEVAGVHQQMMSEMQAPVRSISNRRRILRYTISIAASILVLFIGFSAYYYFSLSPDKLYSQQFQSYELPTTRGETSFNAVEKLYAQKDFRGVIDAAKLDSNNSIETHFLAGLSGMELNDANAAIPELKAVIQNRSSETTTLRERAEYYLALAYLKSKNYKEAIQLMESIHNDPNHIYHDKFSNSFIRKVKMLSWR